nr:response regulator [Paenibacillus sediminis]
MLVDDELPILNNLRSVLPWGDMGIEVAAVARNGVQALSAIDEHAPDIILCDIRMPVMDGMTFLREMREHGCTSEIVMLSGYQEFEYARTAIQYGVKDYICKPIHYEQLESAVRTIAEDIRTKRRKELMQFTPSFVEGPIDARGKKSSELLMISAQEYIQLHLGTDFGIDDIAEYLGISCSYFCLLFKNHFGETFVEYMTKQRIEAAKRLLLKTEKSIAQIGAGVGYHERRYFTKVFQKYTGMTPSEYRDHQRDSSA